ncbi:hypothetical protein Gorai_000043, partial [Gossypium raimondii]|nr:hypothetical protein [Gossypium raimondii]
MAENINALLEKLNFTEEESVRVMSSNVKSSKTQGYEAWAVGSHRRGQSNREIVANGAGKMKCKRKRLKGSNGKNTNESLIRLWAREPVAIRELKQLLFAPNPDLGGVRGGLALLWKEGVEVVVQNYSNHHINSLVSMGDNKKLHFT